MLSRLGHRTIGCTHHQDRTIYLRRACDHVLDVVTVSRHVHMRIVPLGCLVFYMGDVDRDAARFLFRRVINRIKSSKLPKSAQCLHFRDRRR